MCRKRVIFSLLFFRRLAFFSCRFGISGANFQQFDVEGEDSIRRDGRRGTGFAIGKVRGDVEGVFAAFGHQLQAFNPAGNNVGHAEGDGFFAFQRAVEDSAVEQTAFVVYGDAVFVGRFGTFAFFFDFVLQAALGGFHAIFLAVFIEEFFARFSIGGDFFFVLGLHVFHAGFSEGFHGFVHVFGAHRRLFAVVSVFQTGNEGVDVDVLPADVFDGAAHVHADGVADFVGVGFEFDGLRAADNGTECGGQQDFLVCHVVLSLGRLVKKRRAVCHNRRYCAV